MENLSSDLISILQYLLPGFLAAWVFYGLTSHPKPSQFERVIQALIFTLIIQTTVYGIEFTALQIGKLGALAPWTAQSELTLSTINAFVLGLIFAYGANNDVFHEKMRRFGVTKQTSFPSEWFGAFSTTVTYVVLHLDDERRILGWPIEWPSEPDKGHFSLQQASWLQGEEESFITGVDRILICAKDVKWVEFIDKSWERTDGKESIKSTTTKT